MERMLEQLESRKPFLVAFLLLISAGTFLYTFHLGNAAFQDYDEATYAQVTREMFSSGDVFTLTLLDKPWFEKPPLYFWTASAFAKATPNTELAYRLPSAIAGIISLVLVILICIELTGMYAPSLFAGLVLLLSPPFIDAARQMRLDVPVTAAILFGLYSFLRARERPIWALGAGIAIALGILTKSVIGLFVGPLIVIWALIHRDISWLKNPYLWAGGALGLCLIAPWHVYEHLQFGASFWNDYLFTHVVERFDSNLLGGAGTASNQTYISYLTLFALPWTAIFALLVPFVFTKTVSKSAHFKDILFVISATFFIIGFFFVAGTKISYYLTPGHPFIAIFIALVSYTLLSSKSALFKSTSVLLVTLGIIIGAINGVYVGFHYQPQLAVNNTVAEAEKAIGVEIAKTDSDIQVYTYEWPYWETIRYYSNGRTISVMQDDQLLDKSFLLIMPTELYEKKPFPTDLQSHFTDISENDVLTLLTFRP